VKRFLGAAALLLAFAAGCNNACYNLAKVACQCGQTANAIAICNNQVAVRNGLAHPTQDDLDRCNNLLQVCDCRLLGSQTLSSKVACGMARENPADQSLR